jgi:hypothetical protein
MRVPPRIPLLVVVEPRNPCKQCPVASVPVRFASCYFPAWPGMSIPVQKTAAIGETGFEPATARPPAGCATRLRHSPWHYKRATGIEPALEAWKASVQPQHFARKPAQS